MDMDMDMDTDRFICCSDLEEGEGSNDSLVSNTRCQAVLEISAH